MLLYRNVNISSNSIFTMCFTGRQQTEVLVNSYSQWC